MQSPNPDTKFIRQLEHATLKAGKARQDEIIHLRPVDVALIIYFVFGEFFFFFLNFHYIVILEIIFKTETLPLTSSHVLQFMNFMN